ncbi:hypothetical protein [Spirosoma pollinicola]|uniref:Uncharacterized protein n=1 Tax=Spirosoma pollinicola TaxID=2057025 RepID=A0A2K8Z6I8_9BACT|nr:hypothetical protein [Spirosoma pollinicola]AUD05485.1 hypothetical protein CWM47_28735 [Spirosoma pollinicola]
MIKLMLGVALMTTTALAQTTPSSNKASEPKSMTAGVNNPKSKSAVTARSNKPIPPPSQKDNLESKDNAIPSYKQEKDAGVRKGKNRYAPRRTASGARADTLLYRKPKQ